MAAAGLPVRRRARAAGRSDDARSSLSRAAAADVDGEPTRRSGSPSWTGWRGGGPRPGPRRRTTSWAGRQPVAGVARPRVHSGPPGRRPVLAPGPREAVPHRGRGRRVGQRSMPDGLNEVHLIGRVAAAPEERRGAERGRGSLLRLVVPRRLAGRVRPAAGPAALPPWTPSTAPSRRPRCAARCRLWTRHHGGDPAAHCVGGSGGRPAGRPAGTRWRCSRFAGCRTPRSAGSAG